MDSGELYRTLQAVAAGDLAVEAACQQVRRLETSDLGFARLDHHRTLRCGLPEVVFGAGKTAEQIVAIIEAFLAREAGVLVTRLLPEAAPVILTRFPEARHDPVARTLSVGNGLPPRRHGKPAVVSAGTSDQPVALEAVNTLRFFGYEPALVQDVGVAGIHRLLARHAELLDYHVVIVVAGMEGALPSVVGGLISAPLIAVPTSVGYGANLHGLAPLLGMVNSCASGITVTNIDNGYGAACAAARILALREAALAEGAAAAQGVPT